MKYYYSRTESLWCGNWNHLICRKSKCDVDHPSQPTAVNLCKKQKWCSLWCSWYQVKQGTSGPENFLILGCLWTIHHRCTCKWDWTEMMFLSNWEQNTVWIAFLMNTERCRRDDGHNLYPLECRLSAGRLFLQKPRKHCPPETLVVSSSEYLFLESECSFTKYVSLCPNTKYLHLRVLFLKLKAFRKIPVSLFSFSVEVRLYKAWKNQRTWCLLHG